MSVEHNSKALYRRYNARCNAHDFGSLGEFVAEDVAVNGEPVGLAGYQEGLAAVAEVFGEGGGVGELWPPELPDLPDEGWREEGSPVRFVQFSFERDWFCMDLPRDVLTFAEAMEVLWYRTGFFYLRDKPQFTLHGEPEGHDPFRKVYVYGDEEEAAEDAAFLFFRAWELPVDSRLYVSSAAFSGKHVWERGTPLG